MGNFKLRLFKTGRSFSRGENEDCSFIDYNSVYSCRCLPTFQSKVPSPSSVYMWKMEAICSSETLVTIGKNTRPHNPKDQRPQNHNLYSNRLV